MNEESSVSAVTADASIAREFRIDPQYRRCCWYLILGGWLVLAAMFVVPAQVGQPLEAWRIAFPTVMFGIAPVLFWSYVSTYRLRLDEWGLSRRRLGFWSLWPWESFAAGEISFFARKSILARSRSPLWERWMLLGFLRKAENEFLQEALKRVIPPENWHEGEHLELPAAEVTEAVVGLVLTRKLRLDSQGCTLLWNGKAIPWENIQLFRIAKSQQKDMNVCRLEIRFADGPPLCGNLNHVSLNGKSVGSIFLGEETWHERLREIVPPRCWRYFRTRGDLQSVEEGEFRIAEGQKQLKVFKVFWAMAALLLPFAAWNFVPGMIELWNNPFFPLVWKIVALGCGTLAMIQPSLLLAIIAYYMSRQIRQSIAEAEKETQRLSRKESPAPSIAAGTELAEAR